MKKSANTLLTGKIVSYLVLKTLSTLAVLQTTNQNVYLLEWIRSGIIAKYSCDNKVIKIPLLQ